MRKNYLYFGKSVATALLFIFCIGLVPMTGNAQDTDYFAQVGFMKVKQGDGRKYVDLERNIWKPLHQERINKGKLAGWILYRVWYTGTEDPYNYVTVNLFSDRADMENSRGAVKFSDVHPDEDISEIMDQTMKLRDMVKVQLIRRANFVYPNGGEIPGPHKFIVVNHMKSKPGGNFLQVENEIAKPLIKVMVDEGSWAGWSVWSTVFPRGASLESDFVTVDYFTDYSKLGSGNFREAFGKAHPGKDWNKEMGKVGDARSMVRSELWEIVDMALPEQ